MAKALRVHILPTDQSLPPGLPLHLAGNCRSTLEVGENGAGLSITIPEGSRSEIRWLVDQALRRAAGLAEFDRVEFEVSDNVDDDVADTLAMDIVLAYGDKAVLAGRPGQRVAATTGLVGGYRRWVDEDPSTRTSIAIAADVMEWSREQNAVTCEVLDDAELEEQGLALLCAVGQGSQASPPRLVLAHYQPEGTTGSAPRMLLGKGITFDSGGINVKPYESFVSMMKNDMGGAALAYWLFRGLVEKGHPEPLVLVIPTCENTVGETSMRPGSLVTGYAGKTVRIDHTDAEGRLVLADGLAYASERFAPSEVFCFATLTTSALNSYGPYATPVHFADSEFATRLALAGDSLGEDFHFFPRRVWHFEANRDAEADVKNTARLPGHASRGAGSRNAAHFLLHFATTKFTHFDIFGSTWNWAGDAPGTRLGATGAPLRSLLRALSR